MERKKSDRVLAAIRQDILDQKYKRGEKIPAEPELMQIYKVGRSSIREAIKSLVMTGLLTVQQGSGTFLNENPPVETLEQRLRNANFEQINAVRKLLEVEIVSLSTENHTIADLKDMEKHLALRKKAILAEDRQMCENADIAFHQSIAEASLNSVLADLYQNFTTTIRSFFSQREANGLSHFAMSHHLHESLYQAIKAKRKTQAVRIIKNILDNNY